ncbi:MAG: hypothetical protein AAF456_23505 [Planctomycetota bacterium]
MTVFQLPKAAIGKERIARARFMLQKTLSGGKGLMFRFRITHLLAATTYAAVIALLIPFGEMGYSVIVLLAFPLLYVIPYAVDFPVCPAYLKLRFHLPVAIAVSMFACQGLFFEFGWWIFPFNWLIAGFIAPAVLLILQFIKFNSEPDSAMIELRITQLIALWFPVFMCSIAGLFGTPAGA